MGERLNHIDFVKLCLLLIVILSHSIKVVNDDWFQLDTQVVPALRIFSEWVSTFHVHGFTMVSGYLFYYLFVERKKYYDISKFIKNKVHRLIVPYIFIACIWIIPINAILYHMGSKEIFHSFVLMEKPSQLWFLIMLFGCFVIARLMNDYPLKHPLKTFAILIGGGYVGFVCQKTFLDIFQIWTILKFIPVFYLGYYTRFLHLRYDIDDYLIFFVILELILYISFKKLISSYFIIPDSFLYYIANLIINCAGCLMAFVCFGRLGKRIHYPNDIYIFFVKRSMVIYLVHNQFNFIVVHFTHGYFSTLEIVAISFIVTMVLSTILSSALLHFNITRKLVGE